MQKTISNNQTIWCRIIFGAILMICLSISPVMGDQGISPETNSILMSMSSYMAKLDSFSLKADIDLGIVTSNGQKIQLSSFATLLMERPSKFYITRKGMVADAQFIYDGKILTLYGKNFNIYSQTKIPGTIDDAFRGYESVSGISAPGADLFFADPYSILSSGIESSTYIGIAYVNGVKCHHLAFREAKFDWQLWIKTGDKPLPMKYVITSKWQTGAPEYEIRLRDWVIKPEIANDQFSFSVPDGAIRLEKIQTNQTGDFIYDEENK